MDKVKSTEPEKPNVTMCNKDHSDSPKGIAKPEEVCAVMFHGLLHDSYRKLQRVFGRVGRQDYNCFTSRLWSEGVSFAASTLPKLFDAVVQALEQGTLQVSIPGFKNKKVLGLDRPVFLGELIDILIDPDHMYKDTYKSTAFDCFTQLTLFFKKVEGPLPPSAIRKQHAKFSACDASLSKIDIFKDSDAVEILFLARAILADVLEGLDPLDPNQAQDFIPRPGNGATNTPSRYYERFRPRVKHSQLSEYWNYDEWYHNQFDYEPDINNVALYADICTYFSKPKSFQGLQHAETFCSRYSIVPKTWGKGRGICMEECEVGYFQHAIMSGMINRLETHPLTRGRVNFTRQDINQSLANLVYDGTHPYATLDMSDASDRIQRRLVKFLFADNPALLDAILSVSSRTISFPGNAFVPSWTMSPISKLAPMGSAICFPVMSAVHFALVTAILLTRQSSNGKRVWVYGDDIIVPNEATEIVMKWLPFFGMKFNQSKSFWRGPFRESCGVFSYKGEDVTPSRLKVNLDKNLLDTESLQGYIACERKLYAKGFYDTASAIRKHVDSLLCNKSCTRALIGLIMREVASDTSIVGWIRHEERPAQYVDKTKWVKRFNVKLQCSEYRVPTFSKVFKQELRDRKTGQIAYLLFPSWQDKNNKVKPWLKTLPDRQALLRWFCMQSRHCAEVEDWVAINLIRYQWLPESKLYKAGAFNGLS